VLFAAALVRLALWLPFRDLSPQISDERDYDALATTLAATGRFAFTPGRELTSIRPPLYPAFLAAIYLVTGDKDYSAVRLIQASLSLLTALLIYSLGVRLCSKQSALWATAIYSFYPSLLFYNNLLLTETLFILLLVTTCYFAVRQIQGGSISWAAGAGVALGLAALTRSVVWLAPPFLAIYLLFFARASWARAFLASAFLLIGFVAVVAPWTIRNSRLQQTLIVIDVMGGRNLMMGNYQHTPLFRSWDAIAIEGDRSWWYEVFEKYPPEQRMTQGQIDKLALRLGLNYVWEHPGQTLQRDLVKFIDFWGLERELIAGATRGYFGSIWSWVLIGFSGSIIAAYVAVLFLGIYGAVVIGTNDRAGSWLLLAVVAFICAMHTVTFGHSRYHLPLMPFLSIFAAQSLTHFSTIWARRRTVAFWFAGAACSLVAIGWAWLFIAADLPLIRAAVET